MKVFTTISEVLDYRTALASDSESVGFVPTMGALHSGHLSLVKQARKTDKIIAVSIFVNPIQFNDPNDLKKYPRNLEKDLKLLGTILKDEDFVFMPESTEMYPERVNKIYDFGSLGNVMEGASRHGHFNGVGVVVDRLFRIIKPLNAYFGEKDYQQVAIIRKIVEIENLPVNIVSCPIIREDDGLAMSSRNQLLTNDIRKNAGIIFKALSKSRSLAESYSVKETKLLMSKMIQAKPGFIVEYIEFANEMTLETVNSWEGKEAIRCFIAVRTGKIRLIDNKKLV